MLDVEEKIVEELRKRRDLGLIEVKDDELRGIGELWDWRVHVRAKNLTEEKERAKGSFQFHVFEIKGSNGKGGGALTCIFFILFIDFPPLLSNLNKSICMCFPSQSCNRSINKYFRIGRNDNCNVSWSMTIQ